jgi:hypothetical protein
MTITAQRLLTELGKRAWSGFNADDMEFDNEDSLQAQTELNFAVRYLINLQDFPFRSKEWELNADNGTETYSMPEGQITNIYNADTLESLEFIGDNSDYNKELTGEPTGYWVEYNNPKQKIRLYPIPDDSYVYNVVYNQYKPIIDKAGKLKKFEFENAEDYINMPSNLEYLFMDCLILRAMITNNKDEQDENYAPMIAEFNEAWKVFKRACKPAKLDVRVVW